MFNFFKKKETGHIIGSPAKGKAVPLKEVNDPTFAEEMLGKGAAVIPEDGKIYAPAAGEIGMVFETLHAVSMTTDFGAELLIHIGLDTVKMKEDGFTAHVKSGDHLKKSDLLLEVYLEKVQAAGDDIITPVIVCNTPDYASVKGIESAHVNAGDDLIIIS